MMFFDQALQRLVELCEQEDAAWGQRVERFAVLRDHQGKLHLVLSSKAGSGLALAQVLALEGKLAQVLGGYFVAPILFNDDEEEGRRRLAQRLSSRCGSHFQPYAPDFSQRPGCWFKLERRISKLDWLDSPVAPPWPAKVQTPFIVSFYSFKGGVGRTTALLSCVYQLAQSGVPVAVVDLDLEAPGLGGVLGAETPRGVLDFLVEHLVHQQPDVLDDYVDKARVLGEELAPRVAVYPAGDLREGFLEKLARLDYQGPPGGAAASPVGQALSVLLKLIKGRMVGAARPEYIFIDSRAGLHDLAGLALHGLSHLDVLCARATRQSLDGMELTIKTLGQRKRPQDLRCVMVHTMASEASGAREAETRAFEERSREAFQTHVYAPHRLPLPPPGVGQGAHPFEPEVLLYNNLLARFDSLTPEVCDALCAPSYKSLLSRIQQARPQ